MAPARALGLNAARLAVIRTVVEVAGHTSFKPYLKGCAGHHTIPLPAWLVPIIGDHMGYWPMPDTAPILANEIGVPLRRTLFRTRIWRPNASAR